MTDSCLGLTDTQGRKGAQARGGSCSTSQYHAAFPFNGTVLRVQAMGFPHGGGEQ